MKSLAGAIGVMTIGFLALGAAAAPDAAAPPPSSQSALGSAKTSGPATSAPMSSRALKAALKSARASVSSGRLAEALRQYETVIASTERTESARAEALYWAGMLRLSPDPAMHDVDRARGYLGELKVFHAADGRQDEAAIVLALSEEIQDLQRASEALKSARASSAAATESCRSEKEDASRKLQVVVTENETLKESDSAHRAEIQSLREELKRKDEALRKVKEVVVGWKAPR